MAAAVSAVKRSGIGAAAINGKVYIAGGHTGEKPLKLLEEFEPGPDLDSQGTWKTLPPMLARRTYCTANAVDHLFYVIGGSADGRTLNTFEVFDTSEGEWASWFTKPPMHHRRTMHASANVGDLLFAVGGFDGVRDLALVEQFEFKSNSWRWGSHMDRGRSYCALAVVGGNMYAIGGQDRGKTDSLQRAHSFVDRFELYSERWFEAAAMLHGRVGCAAATLTCDDGLEYIFVCGGSDGDAAMASMERYDPREDVWIEAPPMSQKRLGHAVAVVQNRLYVVGGFDGREPLGTFECFDPKLNQWGPELPMCNAATPALEDASAGSAGPGVGTDAVAGTGGGGESVGPSA